MNYSSINKSVKGATEPQHANNGLTSKTERGHIHSAVQSRCRTESRCHRRGHEVQTLHLLYVTASLRCTEPENIWSSDYYGSTVPFNGSFQACDMWVFACSLIALNNQRQGLDIDVTHGREWVCRPVLLWRGCMCEVLTHRLQEIEENWPLFRGEKKNCPHILSKLGDMTQNLTAWL